MPTTIDLPNCSVAIRNTGRIGVQRQYNQKNYEFPPGKVVVVPFALAHHFFGFEIAPNGRLFRNEEQYYKDTTDETAWYVARVNFLPQAWSLELLNGKGQDVNDLPYNPRAKPDKQISKHEMFNLIRETWENHIEGKLVKQPTEISDQQFAEMPA